MSNLLNYFFYSNQSHLDSGSSPSLNDLEKSIDKEQIDEANKNLLKIKSETELYMLNGNTTLGYQPANALLNKKTNQSLNVFIESGNLKNIDYNSIKNRIYYGSIDSVQKIIWGQKYSFPISNQIDAFQNLVLAIQSEGLKEIAHQYQKNGDDLDILIDSLFDSVEVVIGGCTVDKTYPHINRFLKNVFRRTRFDKSNHQTLLDSGLVNLEIAIPILTQHPIFLLALKYHQCKLNISFGNIGIIEEATLKLNADIIQYGKQSRNFYLQKYLEFVNPQIQFIGSEFINSSTYKYRFCHRLPTYGVLVYFKEYNGEDSHSTPGSRIKDLIAKNFRLEIKVNRRDKEEIIQEMSGIEARYYGIPEISGQEDANDSKWDGYYWIPFTRQNEGEGQFFSHSLINFSRISEANLYIETTLEDTAYLVDVATIHIQPLRMVSGMAGLGYSS